MNSLTLNLIKNRVLDRMYDYSIDACVTCGEPELDNHDHYKSKYHERIRDYIKDLIRNMKLDQNTCIGCPAIVVSDDEAWCMLGVHRFTQNEWHTNLFGYQHKTGRCCQFSYFEEYERDPDWSIVALRGRSCYLMFN